MKLPKITYNTNKYYNDLILNDNYIESSFDNFMSINNITEADKNLYRYYINENFSEAKGRYYGIYREHLYESINELYSSASTVYNNLHGILYHITLLKTYKTKIKYKEIIPKWKGLKYKDEYRDGRIFFIGNNDEKTVQKQLQSIKSTSKLMKDDDVIVLRIDLNKYKYKLRFRIDSSASGYNAYFTEEPIPDYCITCLDLDTWKEIDKNNI